MHRNEPVGIARDPATRARFTYFGVRLTDNNVSPRFQRMAPLPVGPRHRGVDFLLLCALKNQPPTHVRAYGGWRARIVVHTMQRVLAHRIVLLCRGARTYTHRRTSTRIYERVR